MMRETESGTVSLDKNTQLKSSRIDGGHALWQNELLAQYDTESYEKRRNLLAKITVAGAYIKRRGNLMFIGEKSETMDFLELSRCLDASFANLELMGVECAVDCPKEGLIFVQDAVCIYDFLETVIEKSMEQLHTIWLKVRSLADAFIFYLEVVSEKPLPGFEKYADDCNFEDGICRFTLRIGKAGELS